MLKYLAETELQGIQSLILDVKDCAYFGHFNMGTVKRMRGLRDLDIWTERGYIYSSNRGDTYINTLIEDFKDAKEMDPGWKCPEVRVFNRDTGRIVGNVEGGPLIPGWIEENLDLAGETDDIFHL